MKVMVSGASGFVGSALLKQLISLNAPVVAVSRSIPQRSSAGVEWVSINSMDAETDWSDAVRGVEVVVHCAARAHVMNENEQDPLAAYREVNVAATLQLARHAVKAGVKRFIFISSIKVNGESTPIGNPFDSTSLPDPVDPYGISKLEAEIGLAEIAAETGIEVVIIRPSLIYGAEVKGNFNNFLKLAKTSLPLPFGAINNARSFLFIDNLVDFIVTALRHPGAANEIFLLADKEVMSTTQLLCELRSRMGLPRRLFSISPKLLYKIGVLFRKPQLVDRLCGSLVIKADKAHEKLGWVHPFTVQQGLEQTVNDWLKRQ